LIAKDLDVKTTGLFTSDVEGIANGKAEHIGKVFVKIPCFGRHSWGSGVEARCEAVGLKVDL
jgi:hypothetical protein